MHRTNGNGELLGGIIHTAQPSGAQYILSAAIVLVQPVQNVVHPGRLQF